MKKAGVVNIFFLVCISSIFNSTAWASELPAYQSKYIGQEKRTIKSLSKDDIQQLQQGRGWGLAKAAELNGVPGPIHVLQMKSKIALSAEQEKKIEALYKEMKSQAIPQGRELIKLEQQLNQAFAQREIDKTRLMTQLEKIAMVRKDLRYTHLVAHLHTLEILTAKQVSLYNRLRGYDSASPCDHIPEGHDAEMWKKHNDCN